MRRIVFTILAAALIMSLGCSSKDPNLENRQWLIERTKGFMNVYKVAFDKVSHIQKLGSPCSKGAPPAQAALFHAVLQNMNVSYSSFKSDCEKHLKDATQKDPLIREHINGIDAFSQPFREKSELAKCGKVEEKAAKKFFYLKDPLELDSMNAGLKRRMEKP